MTIISRISTYGLHQKTIGDFNSVQSHLANLQNQISSGFKTDRFQDLIGEVEQFVDLEGEIKKLQNYETTNAEGISRYRTQRVAIEEMIQVGDQIEDLMTLRRNGANEDKIAFAQQMRGYITTFARELNTNIGGRYLFAGTRTNVQPVITEPSVPKPVTSTIPDDSFYQGSKENVILRPRSGLDIEFKTRADDEAFQKIVTAAWLSIEGDGEDDDDKLVQAVDMIQQGLDRLISIQADVDGEILNLENINERHESLRLYLTGVSEEIIKTDILTASTQVAIDQTILSASFQAFARINSLNLVDYLR